MAPFFRRFRRGKTDEPPDEVEDEVTEPVPEETGEVGPDEELPAPADGSESVAEADDLATQEVAAPEEETSAVSLPIPVVESYRPVPAMGPPSTVPTSSRAPPPLPLADATAAPPPVGSRTPLLHCFLCGTAMDGSFCPTCRMRWQD